VTGQQGMFTFIPDVDTGLRIGVTGQQGMLTSIPDSNVTGPVSVFNHSVFSTVIKG
jgi:hypothetical protein